MIFPIMIFPMMYMISDFLLDQKEELDRLDRLYKRAPNAEKKAEIREQREYIYGQGLQALRRHEHELPNCVRQYYLGNSLEPTVDQITQELKKIHGGYKRFPREMVTVTLVILITLFTILAIFL